MGGDGLCQFAELLRGEARIVCNGCHREGVDGSVAGNGEAGFAIRHHRVFFFASDAESELRKHANCGRVADAGQLRHGSDHDEILFDFRHTGVLGLDFEPLTDGDLDIANRFLTGRAL